MDSFTILPKMRNALAGSGFCVRGKGKDVLRLSIRDVWYAMNRYPNAESVNEDALLETFRNDPDWKGSHKEVHIGHEKQIQFYYEWDEKLKGYVRCIMVGPKEFEGEKISSNKIDNQVLKICPYNGLTLMELSKQEGIIVLSRTTLGYDVSPKGLVEQCKRVSNIFSEKDSQCIEYGLMEAASDKALKDDDEFDLSHFYRASHVIIPRGIRPVHYNQVEVTRTHGALGNPISMKVCMREDGRESDRSDRISCKPLIQWTEAATSNATRGMVKSAKYGN